MKNTVLIIDDDTEARITAEALLRGRGLHIISVRSQTEVCDIVRCEGAAVVIVGVSDCSVESLRCVRAFRAQFECFLSPTPRIVVLAGRGEVDGRGALRASADVLLHKPFEAKQFVAIVERLVDTSRRSDTHLVRFGPDPEPAVVSGW